MKLRNTISDSKHTGRCNVPQPLKTLNYQSINSYSVKQKNMSKSEDKSEVVKQKQKITLSQYRERAKSKSPAKEDGQIGEQQDVFCKTSEMIGLVNPGIREERSVSTYEVPGNPDFHDDRLESINSVADVSADLANMSIEQSEPYLDETSGKFVVHGKSKCKPVVEHGPTSIETFEGENKLNLKSSSIRLESYSDKNKNENKDFSNKYSMLNVPLSERIGKKSGRSNQSKAFITASEGSTTSKEKIKTAPDIIDLTENEESPELIEKFQALKTSVSSASDTVFGASAPMASFENLTKSSTSIQAPVQDKPVQKWTEIRDKNRSQDVRTSHETMAQSIRLTIGRRNELMKALRKQKALVATVKMSSLPDKGDKLRSTIEALTRDIAELDHNIKKQTTELNEKVKPETSQGMKPPHVMIVDKDGTVTRHPQSEAGNSQVPKQPQVIKIYPAGQSDTMSGGSHVPHNPDNLRQTSLLPHVAQIPPHILQQMYAANPQAMQLYGGRMTAARLREVGSVTKEAIEKLHRQLETCPKSEEELEDPVGLLVSLMVHQRQALMWLVWRERQSPSGGILADDMGLGKTLTMISLILKQAELKKDGSDEEKEVWLNRDKQLEKMDKSIIKSSSTLIIAPASLIHHWRTEIERRCKTGLLRVCMYHGPNREKNVLKLASYDVVLTTYNIIAKEVVVDDTDKNGEKPVKDDVENEEPNASEGEKKQKKFMPNIMRIAWERIVLDEAHNIKNHKSLQSRAVSRLRAGFRWALTGTPIQNDLLDMYSLLRFLRCSPFDEYKVWKRQVDTGGSQGQNRLNVLVKTLLLRRTKSQTGRTGEPLVPLPEKSTKTHVLELSEEERRIYEKVFAQSKSVLKEYLKRHEDKDGYTSSSTSNPFKDKSHSSSQGSSYPGIEGTSKGTAAATGQHILVMLLRLRQCCCHLSLMKDAVDDETQQNEGLELTLEEQMMDLMLCEDKEKEPIVKKSSQIFEKEALSSKMKALLDELRSLHCPTKVADKCKSVIVSQWTSMLDIVALHLRKMNIKCSLIQGNIPAKKRMEAVDQFNNDKYGPEVMLVSLRAGGCGLNLVGGNHLFLLDSHWNPALEDQACDRIYRVGQKKNVYIHRFLCKGTVEEKILDLQKRKQSLANSVLTGSSMSKSKLTLADLRMLFGV